MEFARCARPTRKGEAPLLAAHAERYTAPMRRVTLCAVLIAANSCTNFDVPPASPIFGIWVFQGTFPADALFPRIPPAECPISTEFKPDYISISRSGDSFIRAAYDIRAHESGYVIRLWNMSHNGKRNCQGFDGEFVIQHTPQERYVEIAGDQMKVYLSLENRDQYLILHRRR